MNLIFLQIIYAANIVVAGIVGLITLFNPKLASKAVFGGAFIPNNCMKIIGAFWTSIALLSILGLWFPRQLIGILLVQLSYSPYARR